MSKEIQDGNYETVATMTKIKNNLYDITDILLQKICVQKCMLCEYGLIIDGYKTHLDYYKALAEVWKVRAFFPLDTEEETYNKWRADIKKADAVLDDKSKKMSALPDVPEWSDEYEKYADDVDKSFMHLLYYLTDGLGFKYSYLESYFQEFKEKNLKEDA